MPPARPVWPSFPNKLSDTLAARKPNFLLDPRPDGTSARTTLDIRDDDKLPLEPNWRQHRATSARDNARRPNALAPTKALLSQL